jgi:RNA polymerase subunit RPABC4/transcription elongation factor Spt4
MNVSYRESSIIKRFSSFINITLHSKVCRDCNSKSTDRSARFCRICASDDLTREIHKKNKGESSMIYPSIELNAAHRATICPVCSNENPSGNYCQICASYLVNKCTGMSDNEILHDKSNDDLPLWHKYISECGALLEGDARYCSECNSTSTFYALGYLPHWQEEINTVNESYQLQAVPDKGAPIDISDEDLPF